LHNLYFVCIDLNDEFQFQAVLVPTDSFRIEKRCGRWRFEVQTAHVWRHGQKEFWSNAGILCFT